MPNRNENFAGNKPKKTKLRPDRVKNVKSFFQGAIAKTATRDPHDIRYHKNTHIPLKQSDKAAKKGQIGPRKATGGSSKSGAVGRPAPHVSGHPVSGNSKGSLHTAAAKRHSGGGGGQGKGSGGGSGGGVGEKGLRAQASRMVQQDINSAVRGLENEARTRNKQGQYDIAKLAALYDRSVGDLNHVFGEVSENTNIQNQKIDSRFNQGKTDLAAIYAGLRNRIGDSNSSARNAAAAEQARLGIQESGMGNFDSDAANAVNVANTNDANAQANMTTAQTAAAQIGGMISNMTGASLASSIGQAANTRNQGVNDVNEALRADLADIYNSEREEKLGKAGKVNDLWMQLSDRAFSRRESNRNYALARQGQAFSQGMQNSNFNLSVSKFNSDNLWKAAAQRQEDRRQAAIRRQQAAASRAVGRPNTSGGRSLDSGV